MRAYHETRSYPSDLAITAFMAPDNNYLAHWHIEAEIAYVYEGNIRIGINRESRILREGDMAIIGSGDIHYYDSKDMHSTILVAVFRPEIIDYPGGWPEGVRFLSPFIDNNLIKESGIHTISYGDIKKTLFSILEEVQNRKKYHDFFIKSKLFEFCGMALRHFPTCPLSAGEENRKLANIKKMQELLHYLECNFKDEITLEAAARQVNLSPFHFSRVFRSITGMNFTTYVNNMRIENAYSILKNTTLPVTEVALECGFQSIRHFNRVFKELKGVTPSSIR